MKNTFKNVKEHGYRIIVNGHDTFPKDIVRMLNRLDFLENERLIGCPKCGCRIKNYDYCVGCDHVYSDVES